LRYVRDKRCPAGWVTRPSSEVAGVWGALVRRGLLRSARDGMNPIHEPATTWAIYYLTDEGQKALETAA
jgi:hypothetical protein